MQLPFSFDMGMMAGINIDMAILTARNENQINKNATLDEKIKEISYVAPNSQTLEVKLTTGEVLESPRTISADEAAKLTAKNIKYYQDIISKGADKNDLLSTIEYAGYDAMFDISGKDTILKRLARLDNAGKNEFLDFIKNNPVALTTPYGQSELSELFLSEISVGEFKAKWREFSEKSMEWARANPRENVVVTDTKLAPNYHMDEFGNVTLVSGDPDSDYQIGGPKFENIDDSENSTNEPSEEEKQKEIERNNRMLLRKYNGAKSRNINDGTKSEILKTFFEEFLKNNNPLAFLEIMGKKNISA